MDIFLEKGENNVKKKTPFAHVFYHDIKNKLASIKFSVSILEKKIPKEKKEELLRNIKTNLNIVIEMLKDFIEVERYKRSKLKNHRFNLNELIWEILEELKSDIERKEIEIVFKHEKLPITANKEWLKKAFFNLLHNAIKYNKYKGVVFIKVEKEKSGYLISIKDTGEGISKEEITKIFKKYYTTDKKEGSGIGLNLTKVVIEKLGGSIAVESKEKEGTSFFIYLPKTAKIIRIKRLAAALSTVTIVLLFSIDYFYCLFPQKIDIGSSNNMKIYKLENNVIIKTYKNDKLEIRAYKNLFSTNFKNKIIIKKADAEFITNNNKVEIIAENNKIKNYGTDFEVIKNEKTLATSVYSGAITTDKIKIKENEGFYTKNGEIIKTILPLPVKELKIENILKWTSPYKKFVITISRDKKFIKTPILRYKTSKKYFSLSELNDGWWYIKIQAIKNNLFSKPKTIKYLSLTNYKKALKAYKEKNLPLAKTYIEKSLETINKASYKPYLLKAKLSSPKEALNFANIAYNLNPNKETKSVLGEILFNLKKFKKSLDILKNSESYLVIAKDYFYLKEYKKAKKYLYKVLEKDPYNKEAIILIIKVLKYEKSPLVKVFENQLKELNDNT